MLQARLFINRTIGELLFDGYEDEVIKIADNLVDYSDDNDDEFDYFHEYDDEYNDGHIEKEEDEVKDEVRTESKIPMDKFGWFYKACLISCYHSLLTVCP